MEVRFLHRLGSPDALSQALIFSVSILFMLAILFFDLVVPANIRLHTLYIFPLVAISIYCEKLSMVVVGLALSVAFQLMRFLLQGFPLVPFVTDAIITLGSSTLTIVLARASRKHYLATAKLATTDWLTSLNNRRAFESIVDLEIERQKRYGGVFSLAVLDLDNFKKLNDSKGHHVGDIALKLVADVVRENVRHADSSARLGGDEFAILMPNTTGMDCGVTCQQIVLAIANKMLDADFDVTASVGYAAFERAPQSVVCALQEADKAMYAVKFGAKNRRSH